MHKHRTTWVKSASHTPCPPLQQVYPLGILVRECKYFSRQAQNYSMPWTPSLYTQVESENFVGHTLTNPMCGASVLHTWVGSATHLPRANPPCWATFIYLQPCCPWKLLLWSKSCTSLWSHWHWLEPPYSWNCCYVPQDSPPPGAASAHPEMLHFLEMLLSTQSYPLHP
jgi:hypothetical protein